MNSLCLYLIIILLMNNFTHQTRTSTESMHLSIFPNTAKRNSVSLRITFSLFIAPTISLCLVEMNLLSIAFLAVITSFTFASESPNAPSISVPPISIHRTKDCSAGFELIGKQCVLTEVVQPNLVCPQGTILLNGECATFANAIRICPHGFHSVS